MPFFAVFGPKCRKTYYLGTYYLGSLLISYVRIDYQFLTEFNIDLNVFD